MKKIVFALVITSLLLLAIAGCGNNGTSAISPTTTSTTPRETPASYDTSITVYLPIEYVEMGVLRDFERAFNVGVNLKEFESNEEMYNNLVNGGKYDVLVPSDYMIDRLIQEGLLTKLDHSLLPNKTYIASQYMGPEYDKDNNYQIPYMVGTLGILYNRKTLQISSWQDMFSTNGILLADSERDVLGAALKALGYSMNTESSSELEEAKQLLLGAKNKIQGYYETTDIVDLITAQEAFVGVVYSGDGKIALDLNPSLGYIIPKEGSNKWTDAFVIPANSSNIELAHAFIDFMCSPNIAIRNMSAIGYTSPVQDAWSEFAGNEIMFPGDETLSNCETFVYSTKIADGYGKVWSSVRKN